MALKAGFLIGGDTGETPQSLARKRALIAQIMANGRAPTNIGEGLNALGDGIVANVLERRASAAEKAGQASANEAFAPIAAMFTGGGFGGMGNTSAPASSASSSAPSMAATPSNQPPIPGIASSGGPLYGDNGIDVSATEAYIRQSAQARGIDPDVAVRVARSEGLAPNTWQSNYVKNGKRETSYGPFQLLVGGGLGDKFQKIYGKSPADPSTLQQQIDFALDEAAQGGWSPWYGAAKVGVGPRTGLDQARALGFQGSAQPTTAAEAVTAMGQGGQMPAPQAAAYVDPMVVNPNSRPQTMAPQQGPSRNGLPFDLVSSSPQLARADTRQGILRALTGQTGPEPGATGAFPAAPAPAPIAAPQAAPAPSMAAPAPMQAAPAPATPQGMGQVSTQQLIAAINNPWLNDSQRAIAQSMLDQQMQANDPMRQLQIQKLQKEVASAGQGEVKIAGDRALLIKPDGSVEDVTPALNGGNQPTGFRYSGNSVEAQALNGLIDSGQITPEQAQQLGAGKTITGPNGEIIFMTPQGVFGQPASGGAPQPMGAEPSLFPGDPAQSSPAAASPPRTNIPITDPKVTLDEKKAMTFADRMVTSGDIIDQFGDAGTDKWQVTMSQAPFGIGNMLVSEEFQKLDQARRDFINAQLRRESGAVISDEEFDNANRQYFPQPGDGPEVLKQKAANRRVAIEGMVRDGGPTYKRPAPAATAPAPAAMDLSKPISEMTDAELEALANGN